MTFQTSTLRPGLLVSLKTSVRGNVTYTRRDLAVDDEPKKGAFTKAQFKSSRGLVLEVDMPKVARAKWETERTVANVDEYERASQARAAAQSAVTRICARSAFGLLCPESEKDKLDEAMQEARRIVDEFNSDAELTRISIYIMVGRIAADDVEAVRAINSEVADLLKQMEDGVKNLDVKSIRQAANKARDVGMMLSEDASDRIQDAIVAARQAARQITKAGEQASVEVDASIVRKIKRSRTEFLDLDEQKEIAAPKAAARAVDLDPSVKQASDDYVHQQKKQRGKARAVELD